MPSELGPAFPPDFAGWPTHMSTEDHGLWLAYRPRLRTKARALYFDVRLGGDEAVAAAGDQPLARMWYQLNAKRADVVADIPGAPLLIELRNAAQANAVGRLFTYRLLWQRDPPLPGPLTLELVTNTLDPDVAAACRELNILYTNL